MLKHICLNFAQSLQFSLCQMTNARERLFHCLFIGRKHFARKFIGAWLKMHARGATPCFAFNFESLGSIPHPTLHSTSLHSTFATIDPRPLGDNVIRFRLPETARIQLFSVSWVWGTGTPLHFTPTYPQWPQSEKWLDGDNKLSLEL